MITFRLTNFSAPGERRLFAKYAILTAVIFLPLLWAFLTVRSLYPITAWNVMVSADLPRGYSYCILRGETVSGETIDIAPINLTNALYSRTWTMVNATITNQALKIKSPHPQNAELIRQVGGVEKLPAGARIPELLKTWGRLYNERLPDSSPERLKAIRLDWYRWDGATYSNYQEFVDSWHQDL